jgi:hypothetical protein
VRTTKERLDFTLRTTRSAPLRTTRFRHPFEFVRQFWSDLDLLDTGREKIRGGSISSIAPRFGAD